jgi:predicted dehydrogenase
MKFGIGVIGATGFIGSPYRKKIRESAGDATIVALCARRRDLLEAAGKEDSAKLLTDDWREVIAHPDVNVVLVATPDALHYEEVMQCAKAGKHVICEKPLGINVGQAHEMWAACRDAGLAGFVPFWTRYVPIYVRAREIVQSGRLGDVRAVVYRWHNPRPTAMPLTWRDDAQLSAAGSIADIGSHAYDTMRWMLGLEATRVFAHADVVTPAKPDLGDINLDEALEWSRTHTTDESPQLKKGTAFDYAAISFELENGAVGSLMLSHAPFLRKGLVPDVELHGTLASLSVDRNAGKLWIAKGDDEPELLESVPFPGFGNRFSQHVFPALRAQIAGDPSDHPSLSDGWRVQLFTDAAALSAKEQRAVQLSDLSPADE